MSYIRHIFGGKLTNYVTITVLTIDSLIFADFLVSEIQPCLYKPLGQVDDSLKVSAQSVLPF